MNAFEKQYKSEKDYLNKNPDAIKIKSGSIFIYSRIPKREEFIEKYNELNGLIREVHKHQV